MITLILERASRRLRFPAVLALIVVALSAITSVSQTYAPSSPAVAAPSSFEVTTVKRNRTEISSSRAEMSSGRFTASHVSLKSMIGYQAYSVPESRILGGPKWLNSERFDIQAKIDDSTAAQQKMLGREERKLQTQKMFQQLLADRFQLKVHWETRELPIYGLIVAKNGPRLDPAKDAESGSSTSIQNNQLTARSITMTDLAETLTQEMSRELGRVVVDKSGVEGRYDLALKWSPDLEGAGMDGRAEESAPPAGSAPSIFTAVQEQLGLRLESTRGPGEVLVIDHVEMPTEN